MAVTRNTLLCLLLVTATLLGGCVGAVVYKVGDSSGWTMMGVDYASWASTKTFHVGDSLCDAVFEYDLDFHDVTEVTLQGFQSCSVSSALARYDTGYDSINFTRPGHRYFICGAPGHCAAGQKLDVLIMLSSLRPIAAPAMQPPTLPPSSSSSSSSTPSPSDNSPANAPNDELISPVWNGASNSRVSTSLGLLTLIFMAVLYF